VVWNANEYITRTRRCSPRSGSTARSRDWGRDGRVGATIQWTCEMFNKAIDRGKPVYMINLQNDDIIEW